MNFFYKTKQPHYLRKKRQSEQASRKNQKHTVKNKKGSKENSILPSVYNGDFEKYLCEQVYKNKDQQQLKQINQQLYQYKLRNGKQKKKTIHTKNSSFQYKYKCQHQYKLPAFKQIHIHQQNISFNKLNKLIQILKAPKINKQLSIQGIML